MDFFGYPRTEEIVIDGRQVQYFQRARMEWLPQQAGTPYEVQLTLLGDALTADRQPFPTATPPEGPSPRTAATSPRCATPCGGPSCATSRPRRG